jgi:hypothetical protein
MEDGDKEQSFVGVFNEIGMDGMRVGILNAFMGFLFVRSGYLIGFLFSVNLVIFLVFYWPFLFTLSIYCVKDWVEVFFIS